MADPKYMIFTAQPTTLVIKSATALDGDINSAGNVLSKATNAFLYTINGSGARLTHSKAFEILEIQSIAGGIVSVNTLPVDSIDVGDITEIETVAEGARLSKLLRFSPGEIVAFKTASANAELRVTIREAIAHTHGNN